MFQDGLKIHLVSFSIPQSIVKPTDNIRVSITTMPDECKQAHIINGTDMKSVNRYFYVNITPSTKKIVFVFRKKGFFEDPIIASTILFSKDFPKYNNTVSSQNMQTMSIYEPFCVSQKENNGPVPTLMERRILGQMQFELTLTDPIHIDSIENYFSEKLQIPAKKNENHNPNQTIETLFQTLFDEAH